MNQVTIEHQFFNGSTEPYCHVYLNGEYIDSMNLAKAEALKAELEQPLGCTDDESEV